MLFKARCIAIGQNAECKNRNMNQDCLVQRFG